MFHYYRINYNKRNVQRGTTRQAVAVKNGKDKCFITGGTTASRVMDVRLPHWICWGLR